MKNCRECRHLVSEQAFACPQCGAPYPAKERWDGWGYEYKTKATLFGLPLLHVSFKYRPNRMPVPAKGVIAIGQFASGIVCLAQFGIGVVTVSQFAIGVLAVAQFGAAYALLAQIGVYLGQGHGQLVVNLYEVLALLGG